MNIEIISHYTKECVPSAFAPTAIIIIIIIIIVIIMMMTKIVCVYNILLDCMHASTYA